MSNVIEFPRDDDIRETAEMIYHEAAEGHIKSLLGCGVDADGDIVIWVPAYCGGEDLAAVARLMHRVQVRLDEEVTVHEVPR